MYDNYLTFIYLLNKNLTKGCLFFFGADLIFEIILNIFLRILPINQDICLTFVLQYLLLLLFPHYNTPEPTPFFK